jgi:hypothetical protein
MSSKQHLHEMKQDEERKIQAIIDKFKGKLQVLASRVLKNMRKQLGTALKHLASKTASVKKQFANYEARMLKQLKKKQDAVEKRSISILKQWQVPFMGTEMQSIKRKKFQGWRTNVQELLSQCLGMVDEALKLQTEAADKKIRCDDEEDDKEDEEDDQDDEESQQWSSVDSRVNAQKPSIMREAAEQLHKQLRDTADEVKVQLLEKHEQAMNKLKLAFAHFDQQLEKDENKLQESLTSAIVRKEKEQCTSKPVKRKRNNAIKSSSSRSASISASRRKAKKPPQKKRKRTKSNDNARNALGLVKDTNRRARAGVQANGAYVQQKRAANKRQPKTRNFSYL